MSHGMATEPWSYRRQAGSETACQAEVIFRPADEDIAQSKPSSAQWRPHTPHSPQTGSAKEAAGQGSAVEQRFEKEVAARPPRAAGP